VEITSNKRGKFQIAGFFVGLALFFLVLILWNHENRAATRMAAVAALMAVWWITEAVPLFVTALLPMVLFPLIGIMKGKELAPVYMNSTIFLFIGGFLIALAMEKWHLHKRIALGIIKAIGGGPARITLGFMIATAFLSMWISNTATAIMMVPIGLAIIYQIESRFQQEETSSFSTGLMLGIAYACSVGGIATLVGTPPNLSFARIFQITFPEAKPVAFGSWLLMGFPLSALLLAVIWLLITQVFFKSSANLKIDRSVVDSEYDALGNASFEEKVVSIIFTVTALLWVFRQPLNLGFMTLPGWGEILPYSGLIDDGTVALFMAIVMFMIPARSSEHEAILSASILKRLPWDIVLLFGGGFALAKGFQTTGLSQIIGGNVAGFANVSPLLIILSVCTIITFLTELTSNTATTEMVLPVLASVAVALKINPLMLMIPATIAASQAFMMPVATPPNAIVFGSERIRIADMARIGLVINLLGIVVLTVVFYLTGSTAFGIDFQSFPDWAGKIVTPSSH